MANEEDDQAGDELVLDPGSFTGPERRMVQRALRLEFADLMSYTLTAVRRLYDDEALSVPLAPLTRADGEMVFPDEVLQVMVWVQSLRTDPDAKLADFDGLTLAELNSARIRGARVRGKATGPETSTTSPPESPSADSSPV